VTEFIGTSIGAGPMGHEGARAPSLWQIAGHRGAPWAE